MRVFFLEEKRNMGVFAIDEYSKTTQPLKGDVWETLIFTKVEIFKRVGRFKSFPPPWFSYFSLNRSYLTKITNINGMFMHEEIWELGIIGGGERRVPLVAWRLNLPPTNPSSGPVTKISTLFVHPFSHKNISTTRPYFSKVFHNALLSGLEEN